MSANTTPSPRDPLRGFAFAFAGMVLLSSNYVLAKIGLEAFNPETFAFFWMGLATLFGLCILIARGQVREIFVRREAWKWMLAIGLANTICQFLMWQGLSRLDPSFTAFLGRFQPVMTILLCVVTMGEVIRPVEWGAIAVMVVGGALSTLEGKWSVEIPGIAMVLSSCFFGAMQWTIGKHMSGKVSSQVLNFYRVSLPVPLSFLYASSIGKFEFHNPDAWHWGIIIIGSLCGPCLSYIFMFHSARYWPMSRSAIVMTLQPLVVLPEAYFLLGKTITGWKLTGGIIILLGALCLAILHRADEAASTVDAPPLPDPPEPEAQSEPQPPPQAPATLAEGNPSGAAEVR